MFYVIIAIVFPISIPLLIIGFLIGMVVIVLSAYNGSHDKFTSGNMETETDLVEKTDDIKEEDADYPDEFDHFGEDHDTFEGWCEECEEHEDDLE